MTRPPCKPGEVFGRLTLVALAPKGPFGDTCWLCRCECGNEKVIKQHHLRSGKIQSCGCLNKERVKEAKTIHGRKNTKLYRAWKSMVKRCSNPNAECYKNYGGRGIKVCERWKEFKNFLADMGERPEGLSLERIDVNGNYEPTNCKWASAREQSFNRRGNKQFLVDGEWLFLKQAAEKCGVSSNTAKKRIGCANYEMKIIGENNEPQ